MIVSSTLLTNTAVQGLQVASTTAAAVTVAPAVIESASTTPVVIEVKKVVKLTALGIPYTAAMARQLSDYYAELWDVNANVMWAVIKCENKELNPTQQSRHRYPYDNSRWGVKAGEREKSFGLVQIHLPDNRNVSYSQATDPDFSLNFLAKNLAAGRGNMWTCYRNLA